MLNAVQLYLFFILEINKLDLFIVLPLNTFSMHLHFHFMFTQNLYIAFVPFVAGKVRQLAHGWLCLTDGPPVPDGHEVHVVRRAVPRLHRFGAVATCLHRRGGRPEPKCKRASWGRTLS